MLNTKPASRVRAGPGVSRTYGVFAAPLGLDRVVGGLQKFKIGKIIRYHRFAENFYLLLQN